MRNEFERIQRQRRRGLEIILLVVFLIVVAVGGTMLAVRNVGEESDRQPTAEVSVTEPSPTPLPDLEREEAVAQRVIDFMATNEDTPQNLQRVETLFAAAQCERISSGGTVSGTKRAAVEIAAQAPDGAVGVYARMTWGAFKGMFLVAHFDLDCAPEYTLGG